METDAGTSLGSEFAGEGGKAPSRGHYEQAGLAQAKIKCKKFQALRRRELGSEAERRMAKRVVELACIDALLRIHTSPLLV
jgi:hypothetical protein